MADQKQREVRMNARRKGGNPPRMHRRVHKSIRLGLFRVMQARYRRGMDARLAVRVPWPERVHDSKRDKVEGESL